MNKHLFKLSGVAFAVITCLSTIAFAADALDVADVTVGVKFPYNF